MGIASLGRPTWEDELPSFRNLKASKLASAALAAEDSRHKAAGERRESPGSPWKDEQARAVEP